MSDNIIKPQPGPQTDFLKADQKIVFYGGGAGGGKALRNDQRVLTIDGWIPIGDIEVGQEIVDPQVGRSQTQFVEAVHPQGEVNLYEVLLADGKSVVACKDHLWLAKLDDQQVTGITTQQLILAMDHHVVSLPVDMATSRLFVEVQSIQWVGMDEATCITVDGPESLYITENYIVTHNTWAILADNLKYIHDQNYLSVFFRRTTTEIETNLWPEALKMYKPFLERQSGPNRGKMLPGAKIRDKDKTIIWPSGAKTKFSYLQNLKDAYSWYGSELSRVYWDELQMFNEDEFNLIRSRLRSKASFPSAMRCTMNPSSAHFVLEFIDRFLDEEGFPIRELSGQEAYFIIFNNDIFTDWNPDNLRAKFPDLTPQTYTYIPSVLSDNVILNELEPDYREVLASMPEVKRRQLLEGCWYVNETNSMYFDRSWLHKARSVPPNCRNARGWDKASEVPSPTFRHPDYTASVRMHKDKHGNYYITDAKRFRKQSGERDLEILNTAHWDGDDTYIVMPVDPGSAGKDGFRQNTKMFLEEGFIVKKDPYPPTKGKLQKFEPFSTAAQNGQVFIVEELFSDPEMVKILYEELESFTGERSTAARKDDLADACASVFNYLSRERVIPQFSLGDFSESAPTDIKKIKEDVGYNGG